METPNEVVGVVLGSRESTPLEFWVGVEEGKTVQLDDMIVLETITPDDTPVKYYGIVDQVTKKFEGNAFDTDAFHVADHSLPVQVSYAAHVQVTRLDPEVFVPPHPGTLAHIVHGEAYQKALYFDRMERKIPSGSPDQEKSSTRTWSSSTAPGARTPRSAVCQASPRRLLTRLSGVNYFSLSTTTIFPY